MKASVLEIKDLHASIEGKEILKGVNLVIKKGEIHALMGPNGSGKSTLSAVLMGHPKYVVTKGEILLDGQNIIELSPDKRAQMGLFLAFQYPMEIAGVNYMHFLYTAAKKQLDQPKLTISNFKKMLTEKLKVLGLDESFINRALNQGFSGGEKKRAEILQMLIFQPTLAIMDETDSGLDIDSLKIVSEAINSNRGPEFGALVITHYQRILNYLKPDVIHVMIDGKISQTGGHELAEELEQKGYQHLSLKVL